MFIQIYSSITKDANKNLCCKTCVIKQINTVNNTISYNCMKYSYLVCVQEALSKYDLQWQKTLN